MLAIRKRTDLNLEEIAKWINPMINGWINYCGHFYRSELYKVFRQINKALIWWQDISIKSFNDVKQELVNLWRILPLPKVTYLPIGKLE